MAGRRPMHVKELTNSFYEEGAQSRYPMFSCEAGLRSFEVAATQTFLVILHDHVFAGFQHLLCDCLSQGHGIKRLVLAQAT